MISAPDVRESSWELLNYKPVRIITTVCVYNIELPKKKVRQTILQRRRKTGY